MVKADYIAVVVEDMNAKFDLILEIVRPLTPLPQQIREVSEKVDHVEAEIGVIKKVIRQHSDSLRDHKDRLCQLESD